jgi:hypothetical protein
MFKKFFFFTKLCHLGDVSKYGRARQATGDNKMLQRKGEIGMSEKYGESRHAFIMCNAYCFSIAIVVI